MNSEEAVKNLKIVKEKFDALFADTLGKWLDGELDRHKKAISNYFGQIGKFNENTAEIIKRQNLSGLMSLQRSLCDNIFGIIDSELKMVSEESLAEIPDSLVEGGYGLLADIPENSTEVQGDICFNPGKSDPFRLRVSKRWKKVFYRIHSFFYPALQIFPVLLGKERKKKPEWKHVVPLRNLIYKHFVLETVESILPKIDDLYKGISELYMEVWSENEYLNDKQFLLAENALVEKADFGEERDDRQGMLEAKAAQAIEELRQIVINTFRDSGERAIGLIAGKVRVAGTIECPSRLYNAKRLENYREKIKRSFLIRITGWNRTIFVLGEDWKISLEVFACKFHVMKEFADLKHRIENGLVKPFGKQLETLGEVIRNSEKNLRVDEEPVDRDKLKERLLAEKMEIKQVLQIREIPHLNEIIGNCDFPGMIDRAEKSIRQRIEKLSRKRSFMKSAVYDRPLSDNEVESISPYGLVSFEMAPSFLAHFPRLKSNFISIMQELQVKANETPDIVDFSIESAISYPEDSGKPQQAGNIVLEGYRRAAASLTEIAEKQAVFFKNEAGSLLAAVQKFTADIHELTDNENVFQIKIRIARAKAIEKSRQIRDDIKKKIRYLIPRIIQQVRHFFRFINESTGRLRKHFEVEKAAGFIATDISDFLTETEKAIEKLPFVYQRLFRIEPLESFDFYIERKSSFEKINLAYSRWKEGKFAPVAIIGERGSGKTTLLRKFVNDNTPEEKIEIIDLHTLPQDPQKIFGEIEALIKRVAAVLNPAAEMQAGEKRMIVLDGLEKLFVGYVGGFSHLLKTMEMISLTSHQIFWVCICHQYSWDFLDKSVSISDYFGYHIRLSDLQVGDIRRIVEKRHSYSGFKLEFPTPPQELNIFGLKKSPHEDPVEYNRTRFFEKLYYYSRANIAIALLLWLRSTEKVEGSTFYLEPLERISFDFVKTIPASKMPMLRAIILHNGLTAESFSRVFRLSEEKTMLRLYQLKDDGLVTVKDGVYNINPLVYSPLIQAMLDQNLLH